MPAEEETGDETEEPVADGEAPEVPSHEPFSFKLFSMVQAQQTSNGLRHNDHLRYRQYCTRRLRRLYVVLKHKHGRGRFKQASFPPDFADPRWLEIPMVSAERAWSYGVQLKADNAAAATVNSKWRHKSICRFSKAVKWARDLESVCKVHADQRSQMEAEAYLNFMEGVHLVEKEAFEEAHAKILRCRQVCEYLSVASEAEESALLKAKAQELAPLLRECRYNLGMGFDVGDEEATKKQTGASAPRDLSGLSYRGQGLAIPSDKIKAQLNKCLEMVRDVKAGTESEESNTVIEKYGQLSAEFVDALKDIHADMINNRDEGQAAEWKMLEAFARELAVSMNLERNVVLLWNHLLKLEPLEEVTSDMARRQCKIEEGMRFCDLLKEDIANLRELPETTDRINTAFDSYLFIANNCRCFILALSFTAIGKVLEAASLLDMLHIRVQDAEIEGCLDEPLGRLHPLFERVQSKLPSLVARWRCRILSQLCMAKIKAARGDAEEDATDATGPQKREKSGLVLEDAVAFPPQIRDIPCKPLLFDLAFPCIEAPNFEKLLEQQTGGAGQQKGFLGRLGSRFGGLFGGGRK